ncbi:Hypothetical_protein [Hexamita inflata]|uniref:Hypothetical_protein n=1 Tax=Hexamita inflata TaxID=28002 RepID=A0AA86QE10_9EUKA|nr:Hypothetical protein HINF_LOCUS45199 [Hexamita inflata]
MQEELTQLSTDEIQINFLSSRKINFSRIGNFNSNEAGLAAVIPLQNKMFYSNLQKEMMGQQSLFRFQSDFMFWYFGVMKLFNRELDELKISDTGTIMCIEFGTFSLACDEILLKSKIQILLSWRCQQLQQLLQLRSQPSSRIYGYNQILIQNLRKF